MVFPPIAKENNLDKRRIIDKNNRSYLLFKNRLTF